MPCSKLWGDAGIVRFVLNAKNGESEKNRLAVEDFLIHDEL